MSQQVAQNVTSYVQWDHCGPEKLQASGRVQGGLARGVSYNLAGVWQRQAGGVVSEGCGGGQGQVWGLQGEGTPGAGHRLAQGANWARAQGSRGCERVSCSSSAYHVRNMTQLHKHRLACILAD